MYIDPTHPRAISLKIRERLVWGVKKGITSTSGLIAHGRGEAFDYLVGEKTNEFAKYSIEVAAAYLIRAKYPILSINGNTAALSADEFIKLAKLLDAKIEVNLFHYSLARVKKIEKYLKKLDADSVLESSRQPKIIIPQVASARKVVLQEGIGNADVVFIPLEDGDRAAALVSLGKKVITVDLNPLSRTAECATLTIVDNIVRTMPILIKSVNNLKNSSRDKLDKIISDYNNGENLNLNLRFILNRLMKLSKASK